MTENEPEQIYPVKTLHDFLSEFNKEWYRFKRGTLISLTILSTLLATFILLFFRALRMGVDFLVFIFPFILATFLIYSISALMAQYRFLRKWEHRREQLLSLEEKLMASKLDTDKPEAISPQSVE
ncbi:MAG: hypothetical protein ACBZ72_03745 [Candidatus Bathyarchaeia archaeon]|jgi:uncharacterized membrane protein